MALEVRGYRLEVRDWRLGGKGCRCDGLFYAELGGWREGVVGAMVLSYAESIDWRVEGKGWRCDGPVLYAKSGDNQ